MRFELDDSRFPLDAVKVQNEPAGARHGALRDQVGRDRFDRLPEKRIVARQAVVAAAEDAKRAEVE